MKVLPLNNCQTQDYKKQDVSFSAFKPENDEVLNIVRRVLGEVHDIGDGLYMTEKN